MSRSLLVFLSFFSVTLAGCPTDIVCDANFNRCYKFVPDSKGFFEAEDQCSSYGGHLVSLTNAFEKTIVEGTAESMFIGFSDYWIGASHLMTGNWSWTDGTKWSYTNWFPGQPDKELAVSASLGSGLWSSYPENVRKPFICALPYTSQNSTQCTNCPVCPTNTCPTGPTTRKAFCEVGWIHFPDTSSCYKIINDYRFTLAEKACNDLGAHLTSIHSAAENEFIANFASTGLTVSTGSMTWIGLYRVGATWYWTDRTKVDYFNWAATKPRTSTNDDACVQLYSDNTNGWAQSPYYHRWTDTTCDISMRAAVCKKPETKL